MIRSLFSAAFAISAFALLPSAHAHEYKLADLHIGHPYAHPTMPGQTSGAVYLSVENSGKASDKLVSVSSPAAKAAELHSMTMENYVMKMREMQDIDIKPNSRLVLKPGAYHIMLTGLKAPLKTGDKFPLTLTFEKAGKTEVSVVVQDKDAKETKPNATDKDASQHQH